MPIIKTPGGITRDHTSYLSFYVHDSKYIVIFAQLREKGVLFFFHSEFTVYKATHFRSLSACFANCVIINFHFTKKIFAE